jgi:hypothetical protein
MTTHDADNGGPGPEDAAPRHNDPTHDDLVALVSGWPHVLAFTPAPGDGSPDISWGDTFFYYAPDGIMPQATQPFATIVTKNYPGDESSELDRDGVFRVNIHPSADAFTAWTSGQVDVAADLDRIFPHPVYGSPGWLAVIVPGDATLEPTRTLLREAYELARARYNHRRA